MLYTEGNRLIVCETSVEDRILNLCLVAKATTTFGCSFEVYKLKNGRSAFLCSKQAFKFCLLQFKDLRKVTYVEFANIR